MFILKQILNYVPKPLDNEDKLFCVYQQFDHNDQLLYNNNDAHVELSITYALEPYEDLKEISQVQVSFC